MPIRTRKVVNMNVKIFYLILSTSQQYCVLNRPRVWDN
jgi:hypothetical protein